MKKVFIVHGFEGYPEEGWFPWIKEQLEDRGIEVYVLEMPDSFYPRIGEWVGFLADNIDIEDHGEDIYFIGHSVGCQAILRYLEGIGTKIGGAIFVAGWFELSNLGNEEKEILNPWITTPMDFERIKENLSRSVAIFSDNDEYVPLDNNSNIFEEKLGSEIIIESGKGHFSGEDGITEIPALLEEFLKMV